VLRAARAAPSARPSNSARLTLALQPNTRALRADWRFNVARLGARARTADTAGGGLSERGRAS
jgi:hypothetical protein